MSLVIFLVLFAVVVFWDCLYNDLHYIYVLAFLMWL